MTAAEAMNKVADANKSAEKYNAAENQRVRLEEFLAETEEWEVEDEDAN